MSEAANGDTCLLSALSRLLTALDPSRAGDPTHEAQRAARLERWEDQDYIYIEANLAVGSESIIDICILGQVAHIRIRR